MVKDRGRMMNHPKFGRDRARSYMARGCGAVSRVRPTRGPLAT